MIKKNLSKEVKKNIISKLLKNNGITLVALVVTIIILLIMAGVTISIVTGNDGLFNHAKNAKETYDKDQTRDGIRLAYSAAVVKDMTSGNEKVKKETIQSELEKHFPGATISITDSEDGTEWIIVVNGADVTVPAGAKAEVIGKWGLIDNDINGIVSSGDIVYPLVNSLSNERFYVYSNDDRNVTLMTCYALNKDNNAQSVNSPSEVPFDENEYEDIGDYWSYYPDKKTSYDQEPTIKNYVDAYATKLMNAGLALNNCGKEGQYGRLMYSDDLLNDHEVSYNLEIDSIGVCYWTYSSFSYDSNGRFNMSSGPGNYMSNTSFGNAGLLHEVYAIRPVIEINRSDIMWEDRTEPDDPGQFSSDDGGGQFSSDDGGGQFSSDDAGGQFSSDDG